MSNSLKQKFRKAIAKLPVRKAVKGKTVHYVSEFRVLPDKAICGKLCSGFKHETTTDLEEVTCAVCLGLTSEALHVLKQIKHLKNYGGKQIKI